MNMKTALLSPIRHGVSASESEALITLKTEFQEETMDEIILKKIYRIIR